jgi:lipopolysaccharide/colanic/teichoic acid biosynthesis glycosyltransferase
MTAPDDYIQFLEQEFASNDAESDFGFIRTRPWARSEYPGFNLVEPASRFGPLFGTSASDLRRAARSLVGERTFRTAARITKRFLDILVSLVCIIFLAPALLALAIAVRVDSPGPIFWREERVGQGGQSIYLLKFRTMRLNPGGLIFEPSLSDGLSGSGVFFKMRVDPRVTRLGRFLRRTSLDELPQLFNILRGDLSMVGPRPRLKPETSFPRPELGLFAMRPGLTGLWQLEGRAIMSWTEAAKLEEEYARRWSIGLDLSILWRTLKAIARGGGAPTASSQPDIR